MELFIPLPLGSPSTLGLALVMSSSTPLLLLDANLTVEAASGSFCQTFALEPDKVVGTDLFALGAGEWNIPQLRSLLRATVAGDAAIDAYEMDLVREGKDTCRLVLNAHKLEFAGSEETSIVLAVSDITAARLAEAIKDKLARDNQVLLQELQHRVANSLQIIASVLMQSARKVQSDETRTYLQNAHHRVMSIATLQRQLATTSASEVALRTYFTDLCSSIGASMISDPQRLSLGVTVDDSVTSSEASVSLGLIVTELVINALKHAFEGDDPSGTISVDYRSNAPGWTLTVRDNGLGIPADQPAPKPGLGTGIVEALAKQIGASVTVENADPGTKVSIVHA
jgi:two-component sensor histidine kinase